ncbi:CPBP family intramembrane metalloprotease [Pseudoalteromonas ruthenica]|uniref:CPBP family intramembrane glutamic endopeptidase n=1 Tax=Pseudoalteromonas ruthenica TaxID=151081 RepID=UPI0011082AF0|nr:CPBP family intramembrane glutamic endopeptidase [Pseudoalteromonas ruthenica]TLX49429.1 CPBP family intramembrane metalloprotease [Pseudoalteromonas ruthenica]
MQSINNQTLKIISTIILVQGGILLFWFFTSENFFSSLGFSTLTNVSFWAWCSAALVVVLYVWGAASISTVSEHMFKFNKLKYLALIGALVSGFFEELVFRKLLMDYLYEQGFGNFIQVIVSGLAFGLAHLVWGGKALSAAVNATFYTFFLGAGLALVYIISDRNLALCIVAHTIVTGLIEPGLIKSALLNKLGYFKERT